MPPTSLTAPTLSQLLAEAKSHPTQREACLKELTKVRKRLSLPQGTKGLPYRQARELLTHAQEVLGLLERSMRSDPTLLDTQIGILEALVITNLGRMEEAAWTACVHLTQFLQSMQPPRK